MSAKRDSKGFVSTDSKSDPEVIDVARDAIDFRGESDGDTRHVDKISTA